VTWSRLVGKSYPGVALEHMFVDNAAMQLMLKADGSLT
jgi:isocitrate/isopropylmalate dehydrogenase